MVKSVQHNAVKSGAYIVHKHNDGKSKRPSSTQIRQGKVSKVKETDTSSGSRSSVTVALTACDEGNGSVVSARTAEQSSGSATSFSGQGCHAGRTLSLLQQKFSKKLDGARFRVINEKLYTSRGDEAFQLFQSDPDQFLIYHKGFREQSSAWPYNPLDGIIDWIRSEHKLSVIADMGCGDARLASSVSNKVHSFDLVASNPAVPVVACDIAHVPLQDCSVDIVVFCLSLMGTNVYDFIREAYRILRPQGLIRIAEVRSRFEGMTDSKQVRHYFVPSYYVC
jgi:ribosomal RNA-processing protein 8